MECSVQSFGLIRARKMTIASLYGRRFKQRKRGFGVVMPLVHKLALLQEDLLRNFQQVGSHRNHGVERRREESHPVVKRIVEVGDYELDRDLHRLCDLPLMSRS